MGCGDEWWGGGNVRCGVMCVGGGCLRAGCISVVLEKVVCCVCGKTAIYNM